MAASTINDEDFRDFCISTVTNVTRPDCKYASTSGEHDTTIEAARVIVDRIGSKLISFGARAKNRVDWSMIFFRMNSQSTEIFVSSGFGITNLPCG